LVVVLSVVSALVLFALGFAFGNRNLALRHGLVPTVVDVTVGKPADVDFSLFWRIFRTVENEYVGGPVDRQALVYGAIRGMVAALNDPYSLFLTPDEQKEFFQSLNGKIEGIGAEVGLKDGKFLIIAPLDDSPAQRAGLRPGDEIVSVDGVDVGGLTLTDVVGRIRGPKGSSVTVSIIPKAGEDARDVTITRDQIKLANVRSELRPDGIGVLRIRQFGDDTAVDARKAAESLRAQGASAIVLDLRSNPGGFLEAAVDVASLWIADDPIVFEEYRDGQRDTYSATDHPVFTSEPLAVLIDDGSASASEIVSGALQDAGRGRLFGATTFGKGSVQDVKDQADHSALRLTIATWLTPKGRNINHQGITPDETVEVPKESGTTDSKADPVFDRAVQWLAEQ
jgi:carboxyl-terminal processing protease